MPEDYDWRASAEAAWTSDVCRKTGTLRLSSSLDICPWDWEWYRFSCCDCALYHWRSVTSDSPRSVLLSCTFFLFWSLFIPHSLAEKANLSRLKWPAYICVCFVFFSFLRITNRPFCKGHLHWKWWIGARSAPKFFCTYRLKNEGIWSAEPAQRADLDPAEPVPDLSQP